MIPESEEVYYKILQTFGKVCLNTAKLITEGREFFKSNLGRWAETVKTELLDTLGWCQSVCNGLAEENSRAVAIK